MVDAERRGVVRRHRLPQGAELQPDGGVCFRLWAPGCDRVGLALPGEVRPMAALGEGWHELSVKGAGADTRYQFFLPDGLRVPDSASRVQPD